MNYCDVFKTQISRHRVSLSVYLSDFHQELKILNKFKREHQSYGRSSSSLLRY